MFRCIIVNIDFSGKECCSILLVCFHSPKPHRSLAVSLFVFFACHASLNIVSCNIPPSFASSVITKLMACAHTHENMRCRASHKMLTEYGQHNSRKPFKSPFIYYDHCYVYSDLLITRNMYAIMEFYVNHSILISSYLVGETLMAVTNQHKRRIRDIYWRDEPVRLHFCTKDMPQHVPVGFSTNPKCTFPGIKHCSSLCDTMKQSSSKVLPNTL